MFIPADTVRFILLEEYRRWRDEEFHNDDRDLIAIGAFGAIANVMSRVLEAEHEFEKAEADEAKRQAVLQAADRRGSFRETR